MRQFKARNVAGTEEGLGFSTRAQTVATEALIGGCGTRFKDGRFAGEGSGPHGRLRRKTCLKGGEPLVGGRSA